MSEEIKDSIGMSARFDESDWRNGVNRYVSDLDRANKETAKAANDMAASMKKVTSASGSVKGPADMARQMREQGLSIKEISGVMSQSEEDVRRFLGLMDEVGESVSSVAGSAKEWDRVGESVEKATESVKKWEGARAKGPEDVARQMKDLGLSAEEISFAMKRNIDEVNSWLSATSSMQSSLGGASNASDRLAKIQKDLTESVGETGEKTSRTTGYIDRFLKRLVLWATVGAVVNSIISKITQTLKENIKRLYENTEEYKSLNKEMDKLGLVFTAVIAPSGQFLGIMDFLAQAAKAGAEVMALFGAHVWASIDAVVNLNLAMLDLVDAFVMADPEGFGEAWAEIDRQLSGGMATDLLQKRAEYLKQFADVMALAGDEAVDWGKAEQDLAKILAANDEALERHTEKLREITDDYYNTIVDAMYDAMDKQAEIEQDLADKITDIRADASDDIEDTIAKHNKKVKEMEDKRRSDDANAEARHHLDMEFRRRRHQLSMIQNDRMYQARRRRLVGEGDVLAIEELDENYKLQRQAQEENFQLQMEQAEAMYRLQAKIQEESMRRQMQILQQTLHEQIAEIAQGRDDRIAAAREAAEEEKAENARAYAEKQLQAEAARKSALEDEKRAHQDRLDAIAEQLRSFANRYGLEYDQIDSIVNQHWGEGSVMDNAVKGAFDRWNAYAAQSAAYIRSVMSSAMSMSYGGYVPTAQGRAVRPPGSGGPPSQGHTPAKPKLHPGLQFGGNRYVNEPSLIPVGEGRPERISAQPMYPGNISMSISWRGSPIQVEGSGSLGGMDMTDLGNQLTIAIASRLKRQFDYQFSTKGR
jgi:hypothetical protein